MISVESKLFMVSQYFIALFQVPSLLRISIFWFSSQIYHDALEFAIFYTDPLEFQRLLLYPRLWNFLLSNFLIPFLNFFFRFFIEVVVFFFLYRSLTKIFFKPSWLISSKTIIRKQVYSGTNEKKYALISHSERKSKQNGSKPNTHTALFWHLYDVVLTLWMFYWHRNDVVCLLGRDFT